MKEFLNHIENLLVFSGDLPVLGDGFKMERKLKIQIWDPTAQISITLDPSNYRDKMKSCGFQSGESKINDRVEVYISSM